MKNDLSSNVYVAQGIDSEKIPHGFNFNLRYLLIDLKEILLDMYLGIIKFYFKYFFRKTL